MHGFILFLHFVGLMLGAAGGFGSLFILMRVRSASAEEAATLRALGWPLAMTTGTGLLVLWATGILMVVVHGGNEPALFWLKIVFVIAATVFNGLVHRTYAQMRRTGDVSLAERLVMLGTAGTASVLVAVLLAAYAFG